MLVVLIILGLLFVPPIVSIVTMNYYLRSPADVKYRADDELDV
jgi:putative effector of murein hydrolase LrgA (UPF0299 family)